MNRYTYALVMLLAAAPAHAMGAHEFFARDKAKDWTGSLYPQVSPGYIFQKAPRLPATPQRRAVAAIVAKQVQQKLGQRWVAHALRITRVESRFRCGVLGPRTRHGRAMGPLQVMPGSARALGYDPRRVARDCNYAIAAGVEHMRRCIAAGVRTDRQMSACHVAGWGGWNRRLATRHERYKQQYIRLAMR